MSKIETVPVQIRKFGTVKVGEEGITVQGFYFVGTDATRGTSSDAAIDWAMKKLQEAKGKEW